MRTCKVCGCTEANCIQCIVKTGEPCSWVAEDLCSACADDDSFSVVMINNYAFLSGTPPLQPDPYYNLTVGKLISKVGEPGKNGKATSAHRIDRWAPAIEYAGTWFSPSGQTLAFKLPKGGVRDENGKPAEKDFYVLYWISQDETELYRPNYRQHSLLIIKPVFQMEVAHGSHDHV